MKQLFAVILILLMLNSCAEDVEAYIPHLNGYWEIERVKKGNKIVKTFTINQSIDYWQVNADRSGFRKKVKPGLDGRFIVTQHQVPIRINVEGNILTINYNDKGNTYSERVLKANEDELVILNSEGLTYIYNAFEPINIEDE